MAIYRADQAVVTFAAEAGQGGYPESAVLGNTSGTARTVATTDVAPGDRTVTLSGAATSTSGDDGRTFIMVGNDGDTTANALYGPKEIRKIVGGYNSTTVTVDTPFAFPHAVGAAAVFQTISGEGNADTITSTANGRYISQLPGIYEAVDVPDHEQAFEPRYILGGLTNRNFYEMYKGQETLAGSIGSMVLLNGFPLRFPIGSIQSLPVHNNGLDGEASNSVKIYWGDGAVSAPWKISGNAGVKKGNTIVPIKTASAAVLERGTWLVFGFPSTTADEAAVQAICDGGFDQFTSTSTYEIRQVVSNHSSATSYGVRLNAPLHFDHAENELIGTLGTANDNRAIPANAAFIHKIQEKTSLDSVTWNVAIPDTDGLNTWQRRYVGGKIGSMSLSAEEGGLLTAGWDGVQFLDMVHNVKAHYDLPGTGSDGLMPRFTGMSTYSTSEVGRLTQSTSTTAESLSHVRPSSQPYYFSNGEVQMFNSSGTGNTLARVRSFGLSVSNGEEPRYYIRRQYEGRRSPFEIFEGNREYTMSATIATPDATNPATAISEADTLDVWRELLLAGDYRGTPGMRGFGIRLTFRRNTTNTDYIRVIIPNDGTAAKGGNEQGAFIRTAPHNIGTDNPIQADADIAFRSMKIEIRDGEPMYP